MSASLLNRFAVLSVLVNRRNSTIAGATVFADEATLSPQRSLGALWRPVLAYNV